MRLPQIEFGMNVGTFAIGAAAIFLGPMVLSAAGSVLKTAVKTGLKGGIILYERGKHLANETVDFLGEIATEAREEANEAVYGAAAAKKAKKSAAPKSAS